MTEGAEKPVECHPSRRAPGPAMLGVVWVFGMVVTVPGDGNKKKKSKHNKKVLVTGGGAFNSFFTDLLQQHLKKEGISLILPDANLIQYKEAVIFACLGLLSALRQENISPSITGASMPSISGSFHFPEGYSTVLI
jgi:hypothetical protein